MFVKLGDSTYLNADRIKMVSARDSYTRVSFDDGTSRDINGAWEENLVNWLDRMTEGKVVDVSDDDGSTREQTREPAAGPDWHEANPPADSVLDADIADFSDPFWKPKTRTRNFLVKNFRTLRDLYENAYANGLRKYRGFGDCTKDDLNRNLVNIGLSPLKCI